MQRESCSFAPQLGQYWPGLTAGLAALSVSGSRVSLRLPERGSDSCIPPILHQLEAFGACWIPQEAEGDAGSSDPHPRELTTENRELLLNQLRIHRDLRFQHFRNRASALGVLGGLLKGGFIYAGDFGRDIKMNFGDGKA